MKKLFTDLTRKDVEYLRRKSLAVPTGKHLTYNFTSRQIEDAVRHLENLYLCTVRTTFAAKILILNELY